MAPGARVGSGGFAGNRGGGPCFADICLLDFSQMATPRIRRSSALRPTEAVASLRLAPQAGDRLGASSVAQRLLGLKIVVDNLQLVKNIQEGLPHSALVRVKTATDLPDTPLSAALGVSTKTLTRMRESKAPLSPDVGDRLYRLAHIVALAQQVLESPERARDWLLAPQFGLNRQRPIDLMTTDLGAREVEDLLLRIEHGALA